uniref:Putative LAGLIDADG homing endonuclease n=2 Tax=Ignatiaceae TaxID=2682551 RepID=A0A1W6EGZ4_9CHLO|nr:putative LAGLIDADG homing endonuclease [Pseudocharacium americanum]YP_009367655.1 putative LAGLIDADG homing endonuclease [Pseudocharacium americanum]YP_009367721.1 putative LAGLIDADG homing endonuclease [Ignatius tetrasporus]YP_009367744.1 putative LAGLIDADG homing endonuclease [Ignatius tetrasporus]ARK14627.1 putative LAGLIDADG homing endonuclease [Pseudocharacium americanum]ARK14630.1 putative LAGLIDADG homing endonuclease [Pseudocharacium americanum]ARK14714.1 putative LAGLIDADG homing 
MARAIPWEVYSVKTLVNSLILTDPLALAVWYLDDGTKRSDTESCRIATQSFSKEEHELLQNCFKQNFNISVQIEDWGRTKDGSISYSLAILSRGGNFKKFRDVIYDIVNAEVPSMLYKL